MKVVIIGGGWAGCAAALSAKKAGADVTIIEKTDLLLGLGNVGGIMRNNGRFTASEELIALGCGDLIQITDKVSTHTNIDFPGHKHATLYNVNMIEGEVRKYLTSFNINLLMESRVTDINLDNKKINGVYLSDGTYIDGDVFIETTGTTGPMGNCLRYGNGCSMCVLRCPAFGPRISISQRCGVADLQGERGDDILGAFSGSCKLAKESLSEEIRNELDSKGVVILKVPEEDVNYGKLSTKVCQQYALKEFAENIILLDTGHAKLMTTYYPLHKLRKIKGLENAKYVDPYAGSKGNSIRYLSVAPRTNDLKVTGVDNLFCAGEKSGLFVGHTEAICTGTLAGHNAVKLVMGMPLLILPSSIAIGDLISYANEKAATREGRKDRYTFAGASYFKRMQKLGLYTTDIAEIQSRIDKINLTNIFNQKLC
ncbi:FAD-dependent oxidoreductase [Clostridium saccharobutylicum]|uniref:Glucose-inhibited division protein A n=1 Tax=Clostridium saccharobutylicum DSM 13864 TaxID=1345695 RepID=U5MVC8_CLOSA|nr:FAD-dependent oxidoreductase [Clostridium saccharobutylicum]AGX43601.1 glucose-inhibited division protein A [Clostridium saccharobutylicum DSM 13864]AQR90899.1 tRNA uridine 5-carboxymethylaminomethyl modification enzyme MnmG [Clostridium saccharobutylicum]AQS00803.1 tRNA uridine 5-carboxymethylaminomethyl modification enzyme MnmG [Clostridium saccharobutylicum]AQS10466.1 tRNA uridine 5-carboxymethylaminomethyl modification enzyme MnmG [Clostridium saccharobutylicum]AQS14786.1 tRNA uridine 5